MSSCPLNHLAQALSLLKHHPAQASSCSSTIPLKHHPTQAPPLLIPTQAPSLLKHPPCSSTLPTQAPPISKQGQLLTKLWKSFEPLTSSNWIVLKSTIMIEIATYKACSNVDTLTINFISIIINVNITLSVDIVSCHQKRMKDVVLTLSFDAYQHCQKCRHYPQPAVSIRPGKALSECCWCSW